MNSVTEKTVNAKGQDLTYNETTNGEECYRLVHDGTAIISYFVSSGYTATKDTLFVGTKEECDAEITNLDMEYIDPETDDDE